MMTVTELEEDYRVKNARLGLAIYVPGKSVEETLAKINKDSTINLTLTHTEAGAICHTADEVEYLCSAAGHVFEALRLGITSGHMTEGDTGVHSILELCGRGMRHAEEHEGRVLSDLARNLRGLGATNDKEV